MKKYIITNEFYYISNYTNERVNENQIEIEVPEEYKDIFSKKFMFFKYIDNMLTYENQTELNEKEKTSKNKTLFYLKTLLEQSDYKIIKCYEASLLEEEMPYNLQELLAQRKAWREQINALEFEISMLV
jgi:hypothetical protein